MNPARTCPQCSAPLSDAAPDGALCPRCLQAATDRTVIDAPADAPTVVRQLSETIGDFQIIEKLGAGGMGAVYKARQISLDRIVALKVLPSQFADDADYVGRFRREAKVASSFHHENLVSVYNYGTADGIHYIAMELVEGENLSQLMRTRRVDMAEALGITAYVAKGLKCGWDTAQLVHRDVKPSNIYLSYDGHVKVGDLGLAKSLSSNTTGITQSGTMMGTPHYMSPEQVRADKAIDFRADIYSLGCMLFEMLTGHPPYPGGDPVAIVNKHLNSPPPGLLKDLPGCPVPLALLVGRMLKKSPRDRHGSYDELIAEIEALYEHIERGELLDITQFRRPVQRATPAETTTDGMPEWVMWAVIALVAVGLAIVFWPTSKKKPSVAAATPTTAPATPRASPIAAATPKPAPAPAITSTAGSGSWQQLFARDRWVSPTHLTNNSLWRTELVTDRFIRARIRWQDGSAGVGLLARLTKDTGSYKFELQTRDTVQLAYFPVGSRGGNFTVLGTHTLPKPLQPGDTALLELHVEGDRMTAFVDGAMVIEARDSRLPGPGVWGIVAGDGWFESVEVQTPPPAAAPVTGTFGPWQPLFTEAEWNTSKPGQHDTVDGRWHVQAGPAELKPQPAADGAIRARIQWREGSRGIGINARAGADLARYKLQIVDASGADLTYLPPGSRGGGADWLGRYAFPTPLQPGDTVLLELRMQGDRLTALLNGTVIVEARDSRAPGPGSWGVLGTEGWFESVEVQTPL